MTPLALIVVVESLVSRKSAWGSKCTGWYSSAWPLHSRPAATRCIWIGAVHGVTTQVLVPASYPLSFEQSEAEGGK